MSRFLNSVIVILYIAIFSGSPVFSSEIENDNNKTITGILVRVEVKKKSIYIKENSRIVKFHASSDICEKFKDKINFEVDIAYKVCNNKTLQIITITVSEQKNESAGMEVKYKSVPKGKMNK